MRKTIYTTLTHSFESIYYNSIRSLLVEKVSELLGSSGRGETVLTFSGSKHSSQSEASSNGLVLRGNYPFQYFFYSSFYVLMLRYAIHIIS